MASLRRQECRAVAVGYHLDPVLRLRSGGLEEFGQLAVDGSGEHGVFWARIGIAVRLVGIDSDDVTGSRLELFQSLVGHPTDRQTARDDAEDLRAGVAVQWRAAARGHRHVEDVEPGAFQPSLALELLFRRQDGLRTWLGMRGYK